jgi:predicted ATP-binding protein involved in virulence
MESLKKKHTLTFYRRMANTNPEIMKRYKSAVINRMSFKQLIKIYTENKIKFEEDISRLLEFKNSKLEPIHEIKLINLYNSNLICKKYPYIKKDSIIYTILNTILI